MPYLVERNLLESLDHLPCDDLKFSLEMAAFGVRLWIWQSRCDPPLAEQLMALIRADKHREAVELWNSRYPDRFISVHEFEFVRRDCQHDPSDEPTGEDIYYLVEVLSEDYESQVPIQSRKDAFRHVRRQIGKLARPGCSVMTEPCRKATRKQLCSLFRQHRYAEAIDLWNNSFNEPKIAMHKIRLLETII
jgi:hypothetical protein